jgi:hypothetical protein
MPPIRPGICCSRVVVDAAERDIYYYLKGCGQIFTPAREVSRRLASKPRWRRSPSWAQPIMERMAERGILEFDNLDGYRLKPIPKAATAGKRWISPDLVKILKDNGKDFGSVVTSEDSDEYYDRL